MTVDQCVLSLPGMNNITSNTVVWVFIISYGVIDAVSYYTAHCPRLKAILGMYQDLISIDNHYEDDLPASE